MARKPRGFFKASDWELEDAEEENVEILINHSPKEFVLEDGKLVGMTFRTDGIQVRREWAHRSRHRRR